MENKENEEGVKTMKEMKEMAHRQTEKKRRLDIQKHLKAFSALDLCVCVEARQTPP